MSDPFEGQLGLLLGDAAELEEHGARLHAEYLGYFSLNAIGLTGHKDQIDRIIKQYGGDYFIEESDSAAGPLYAHTTYLYLIDREGTIRFLFTHEDTPEWIAAGVAQLLETEPS